jgi:hypothetical protein
MKKLFLTVLILPLFLTGMGQDSYIMYETMYIKPKHGKSKEFNEALVAHTNKYHSDDPYRVAIHQVMNGTRAGQLVRVMGPLTFTDLDSRPSDPEHEAEWTEVMTYLEEVTEVEYWRLDPDLSYTPEGWNYTPKIHLRAWELKHGKTDEFLGVMKKIVEVFRAKKYGNSWHVYWNYFQTGNGRDIAGVFGFDKWAFYDEDPVFFKDFEEIHGEGSWEETYEFMMDATVEMTEELRELRPDLSGASD